MKIIFFDLETQYLFRELGMNNFNEKDSTKLKLAIAGILSEGISLTFEENDVDRLVAELLKADLIVGHNLLEFDYNVLRPYITDEAIEALKKKTFDMFEKLKKLTGQWISLDDLGIRNVGIRKTVNTLEIPKMWREGKKNEVKEYLVNDLKMTESIFNHGVTKKSFKYDHKDYGKSLGEREVSVEW